MKRQKKRAKADTSSSVDLRRYTVQQAAEATGISPSSLRRACRGGELRFMRLSGRCNSAILISHAELLAWLERCEENRSVLSPSEVRAMRQNVQGDE